MSKTDAIPPCPPPVYSETSQTTPLLNPTAQPIQPHFRQIYMVSSSAPVSYSIGEDG